MLEVHRELVKLAVAEMRRASATDERARIVKRLQDQAGVSQATAYRWLQRAGYESRRAPRADRGVSRAIDETQALAVAALCAKGRDLKGRPNMPVTEAVELAISRGLLPEVSPSTVTRVLNRMGLGPRAMLAPRAGITRVSQHPNHVWAVDVSVCLQWYWRDKDGKRLEMYHDGQTRFYPGKGHNFSGKKLLRYLVVDHYSGTWYAQYTWAEGETAVDMVDFLYKAMAKKALPGFPFHGIPRRLLMDQGPAGKSHLIQNLCRDLGITLELHAPGNAKASGSVETRHYKWQRTFEARLAHERPNDLTEINKWAESTTAAHSGARAHGRHGHPPLEVWCRIAREQLRAAPPRKVFYQLASAEPRTATLTNKLWLRAEGKTWQVRGAGIYPGLKVVFRLSPFLDEGIRVWLPSGGELAVTEISFDAASGFPISGAHMHVWDDPAQAGSVAPATPGQDLADQVARGAAELPDVTGLFQDLLDQADQQHYLCPDGVPWEPPAVEVPVLLSRVDALDRVVAALGRWLSDDETAWFTSIIGDGCTEADLIATLEQLANQSAAVAANQ